MSSEIRAFVNSYDETVNKIKNLGAEFKGKYSFTDYIYQPRGKEINFNNYVARVRLYHQTQWDQKSVELTFKHNKFSFDTLEDAFNQLSDYELILKYKRDGLEFKLNNANIFIENIQGLEPSIEIVASSSDIFDIFSQVQVKEILNDCVPQLIYKKTV